MAGARREATPSGPDDFDVEAAFEPDFDFDALFAADELDAEEVVEKARVPRSRVALALSITLAALPLLFLDNFQANASTPARVDASALHDLAPTGPPAIPDRLPTTEVPVSAAISAIAAVTPGTVAPAVVYNAAAPTTVAAPITTTTKAPVRQAPAPTTTTTAKPKLAALIAPVTTTTKPPAPATTTTKPAPSTTVASVAPALRPGDPDVAATWDQLARCESNSNWAANTGNGYYGGLQFSLATWQNLGGTGYPQQATKATQIAMGKKLYKRSGWKAWPGCSRKLGWIA